MIETLVQVSGKDGRGRAFCAGLVLWDDEVVEMAPILRRAFPKGTLRGYIRGYCRKPGWTVVVVHELRRADIAKF